MAKYISVALCCFLLAASTFGKSEKNKIQKSIHTFPSIGIVSDAPNDCPFERSKDFEGLIFTGKCATYTAADTWYPSWASDGHMYSPWTDGYLWRYRCASFLNAKGYKAHTAQAKIIGNDPMNLKIENLGKCPGPSEPYGGRYPSASLIHNGVWYYGTYCLDWEPKGYHWGTLGPFVGFRTSKDFGKTWTETKWTPEKSIFGETGKNGSRVKIGAPHFVDFGKNMEHSPDGKAYLVAHGGGVAEPNVRPADVSWINGDQVYLIRVTPSLETINDPNAYEFFAGRDKNNKPLWSRNFADIQPLVEWNNNCGCVTVTYNPVLKRYWMCVTEGYPKVMDAFPEMNTWIAEAEDITGPWKLATYMPKFGQQAYFMNFPSKFIQKDGRTAWLCYSNNYTADHKVLPPGAYAMTLHEIIFADKETFDNHQKKVKEETILE